MSSRCIAFSIALYQYLCYILFLVHVFRRIVSMGGVVCLGVLGCGGPGQVGLEWVCPVFRWGIAVLRGQLGE